MNDCIIHQGRIDQTGYGKVGRRWAHRKAWVEANGCPIPKGMHVMHLCDNKPCVNPDHLRLGTPGENMQMAWDNARITRVKAFGEGSPHHKLTDVEVRAIRASGETNVALGARYGVHASTISEARRGITWPHL